MSVTTLGRMKHYDLIYRFKKAGHSLNYAFKETPISMSYSKDNFVPDAEELAILMKTTKEEESLSHTGNDLIFRAIPCYKYSES